MISLQELKGLKSFQPYTLDVFMATMGVLKMEQTEGCFRREANQTYKFVEKLVDIKTQIDNGADL